MNQSTRKHVTTVTATLMVVVAGCSGDAPPPAPQVAAAVSAPTIGAPFETREPNNPVFKPAFEGQTRAPGVRSDVALDVQVVTRDLKGPWAFELLPDGRALVTEREGRLRIVGTDGSVSAPATGLPDVHYDMQGGLLDVALDPQFAQNRTIYWSYAEPRSGGNGTALARGVLVDDAKAPRVEQVKVIFRQLPTFESFLHYGSRIAFAPDGKLFLTLGERGLPGAREQSQSLGSHFGKVIRINPDGSVPQDNPFVGRNDAKPEIWSYGHRNMQAAAIDPQGRLWDIEHGPRGGDELNRPEPGKNYGWPVIGYGIDYSGAKMHDASQREGLEQPVYYWDPVIAPSGMIFYSGKLVPQWQGNVFVGGLGSMKLVRLQLEGDRVTGEEWLLQDKGLRIRDVKEGPEGELWLLAEGPEAQLMKVTPRPGAAAAPVSSSR